MRIVLAKGKLYKNSEPNSAVGVKAASLSSLRTLWSISHSTYLKSSARPRKTESLLYFEDQCERRVYWGKSQKRSCESRKRYRSRFAMRSRATIRLDWCRGVADSEICGLSTRILFPYVLARWRLKLQSHPPVTHRIMCIACCFVATAGLSNVTSRIHSAFNVLLPPIARPRWWTSVPRLSLVLERVVAWKFVPNTVVSTDSNVFSTATVLDS